MNGKHDTRKYKLSENQYSKCSLIWVNTVVEEQNTHPIPHASQCDDDNDDSFGPSSVSDNVKGGTGITIGSKNMNPNKIMNNPMILAIKMILQIILLYLFPPFHHSFKWKKMNILR